MSEALLPKEQSFSCRIKSFDGPVDMLLQLLRKAELHIYDVPISEIIQQFLAHLKILKEKNIDLLSDFYRMAVALMYMKSQMLLPDPSLTDFDSEGIVSSKHIIHILLEYQRLKKLSHKLIEHADTQEDIVIRNTSSQLPIQFDSKDVWKTMHIEGLMQVFLRMTNEIAIDKKIIDIYEPVTTREKIALIYELIEQHEKFSFTMLFQKNNAVSLVCAFLAVLELIKQQVIIVLQNTMNDELVIMVKKGTGNK